MQIYEILQQDHVKMKDLLGQLVEASKAGSTGRGSLLEQIRVELIPHMRAEEAVFYNCLRDMEACKSMTFGSYAEHVEAESVLRSLQVMNAMDFRWLAGAKKLKELIETHMQEEEKEVFEAARRLFTSEESEVMGETFLKMKQEIVKESFLESTTDLLVNMMPDGIRTQVRRFTNHHAAL